MANKRVLDPCCGRDVREKLVEQKIKGHGESICYKCFHNKVCKAMDNQPCVECNQFVDAHGVTVQEWISVKDRLPEKREDVLLCRKWWGEISNPKMGWYNEVSGKWFDLSNFEICNVTHWMPMPQPPKGE